jgi:hypothetical protein
MIFFYLKYWFFIKNICFYLKKRKCIIKTQMIEILPTSFIQKQYAANKKYILYK